MRATCPGLSKAYGCVRVTLCLLITQNASRLGKWNKLVSQAQSLGCQKRIWPVMESDCVYTHTHLAPMWEALIKCQFMRSLIQHLTTRRPFMGKTSAKVPTGSESFSHHPPHTHTH